MPTFTQQAIEKSVSDLMGDPDAMATLAVYVKKMRDRFFDWHQDAICQKFERFGEFDIYDAYPFMHVHMMMTSAEIVCATMEIGVKPKPDSDVEGNRKVLRSLKHPFTGDFWGGTQDEDGVIEVKEDIEFDMINLETRERVSGFYSGRFPLEVGYISAAKTLLYLNGPTGRLARWPYGSKNIYLFQRVDL